ncbi:MAG: DUF2314 domain-containing protein [Planctomycetes bacterium]|nr:DUF2314 domain-containing protein [Planctomycetota bacterium]
MQSKWPFEVPRHTASFTTRFVLEGAPVLRVYHDYDGDWQFHGATEQPATASAAQVVALGTVVDRDPTFLQLHDLPIGWVAERKSASKPWRRAKNHPFPTFAEDGYYLEDADWLAQFRDDVHPPAAEDCEQLAPGMYVKLAFRFQDEQAERRDFETERMWVLITDIDDQGTCAGTLENDPQHADQLSCGAEIHFHPSHVLEILEDSDS